MAAEPTLFTGGEHVVEETEEAESDAREQHERTGAVEARLVTDPERTETDARALDEDDREHHDHATGGRQVRTPVVAAQQRGCAQQVGHREQDQPRHSRPDHEPEHDGDHGPVHGGRARSAPFPYP